MSTLILVRHGQATPFEADTDQLSSLGERQAGRVGEALAREDLTPTLVLHGPMIRQARSATLAAHAAPGGGAGGWPAPLEDPRLAEYDGDGIIGRLAPLLSERDPVFAGRMRDAGHFRGTANQNRAFQHMLEHLLDAYLGGELTHPQVESWRDFKVRVQAALRELLESPPGSTVLAFTSGGVIGVAVASVLDAPDASALKLNWRVRNASLTRFTFGGGRVSLDSFNEVAHLPPELLSWR